SNEFDNNISELNESNKLDEKLKIISEFMAADKFIQEHSIILPKAPDIRYKSKVISTQNLAQQH
ncbi:81_t:CDS:1, partial [Gigaspora margarita]